MTQRHLFIFGHQRKYCMSKTTQLIFYVSICSWNLNVWQPSRSYRVVYSAVLAVYGTDSHGFEPQTSTNACRHNCRYVDQKGSAAMLTSIQSAGVIPEVNLRMTQARKHAKGILALKPGTDITRSPKQGYQWPHEKDWCPTKILKKPQRLAYSTELIIKSFRVLHQVLALISHLWWH